MAMNLYQKKAQRVELANQAKDLSDRYQDMLADTTSTVETRKVVKDQIADINDRLDAVNGEIKREEAEIADRFNKGGKGSEVLTPQNKAIENYANMIRDVYKNGKSIGIDTFKNETSVGGTGEPSGTAFLPITVSNELISEPETPNPLRNDATYSTLVNLRIPRAEVEFGDAFNTILDGEEAKEATLKGDQITFGRFESKVRIGLTDTLLAGSNLGLVQFAQSQLENAASELELARAFAQTPATGEEHMSLYSDTNAIKKVGGATLFDAINMSLADLKDADRNVAKIYMTPTDFASIKKELANGAATLWGATPQEIFGVPVQLTSYAKTPVIGNFSKYQGNYDPQGSLIEQYRKPETGVTYAQITLWYDAQLKRASALRLAVVNP